MQDIKGKGRIVSITVRKNKDIKNPNPQEIEFTLIYRNDHGEFIREHKEKLVLIEDRSLTEGKPRNRWAYKSTGGLDDYILPIQGGDVIPPGRAPFQDRNFGVIKRLMDMLGNDSAYSNNTNVFIYDGKGHVKSSNRSEVLEIIMDMKSIKLDNRQDKGAFILPEGIRLTDANPVFAHGSSFSPGIAPNENNNTKKFSPTV